MRIAQSPQNLPINIVGSSKFGIWPKISLEKTYNMFVSDGWLINYAGYLKLENNVDGVEGRGLFLSIRGEFMVSVIDDKVYRINASGGTSQVGKLDTRLGEVFMDENLSSQICIVDGNDAWIYNYENNSFTKQALDVGYDVVPGYVVYHNSFFLICPSINDPVNTFNWFAFQYSTPTTIAHVPNSSFPLQTKPDNCLAVQRLPGKGNNVLVIGSSVCEVFTNVGGEENYRRNSSFNIDSGCVSISTIASDAEFVCFLSKNEKSAPSILWTDGAQIQRISTDGIDNLLQSIQHPEDSTAFFFRQDGHVFYQLTFFNPADNLTLCYDFTTNMFFHLTDENLNFHPARQIVYFNNKTYFIGISRGSLYEFSTNIPGAFETVHSADAITIPRIRITNTVRSEDGSPFFANNFNLLIEQGVTDYTQLDADEPMCELDMITEFFGIRMLTEGGEVMLAEDGYCSVDLNRPRVDMSFSKNGNQTFSNIVGNPLNTQANFRNRLRWFRLGFANEFTIQLRFWGLNRFIAHDGILEIGK